jgi:hypothetical protein
MLVTGVLTTGDRYHSKVSDLQGFVAVQISGANKVIILILMGGFRPDRRLLLWTIRRDFILFECGFDVCVTNQHI